MSCENKLTNLVFKNEENSAKTQFAPFPFPFFYFLFFIYIYIYIYRIKTPRMKSMNVMQCKSQRQKKKKKVIKGKTMKHMDYVKKTQLD